MDDGKTYVVRVLGIDKTVQASDRREAIYLAMGEITEEEWTEDVGRRESHPFSARKDKALMVTCWLKEDLEPEQ